MKSAELNGAKLEYDMKGSGEAVLLISPVLADGFLPFFTEPALSDRYRLIRYHRRGWAGSTHTSPPVSIADHAADAAALLAHLGIRRAHIAGHSSGGTICLQLALDRPDLVRTLALLEPTLLKVPAAQSFFEKVGPALEAYRAGDHPQAVAIFLSAASGLDWQTCRKVLEQHAPGVVAQTVHDADTFFGIELPSLLEWSIDPQQAAAISQPVLSIIGAETERLWVDVAALLRSCFPQLEECMLQGVGHLLHLQSPPPVAKALRDFLARHPVTGGALAPNETRTFSVPAR
jgi:pimeloyl-ACP methyl ester carboxylesterase